MRQAIVVGLGEKTQHFLQEIDQRFMEPKVSSMRTLLLTPTKFDDPVTKKGSRVLMTLSEEQLRQLYYDPHVRTWSAANWGKWGAALLDTRLFGKLAAYAYLDEIYKCIKKLDDEMAQHNRQIDYQSASVPLDLYLIAHLSEPFASGALFDIAYMLDHYASFVRGMNRSVRVYGLLMLPNSATTEHQGQSFAVSYAALRELALVQGGYSFYENHHFTPNLDIKHENHSPFESGGCFVVGGDRNEGGGPMDNNILETQLIQWITICSFTDLGDHIASRIHLGNTASISSFGLQLIDLEQPENTTKPGNTTYKTTAPERAQVLAALRALAGANTRLDEGRRSRLQGAVRLFLVNASQLQSQVRSDWTEPSSEETPSFEDSQYRTIARRLTIREQDLDGDLDKAHDLALNEIWQALIGPETEAHYPEKLTFENVLRRKSSTLEACDRECRVIFETVEAKHESAQERLSNAEREADAAAARLLKTRGSAAYAGYTQINQSTWRPISGQYGVWFVLLLFTLLFALWFLALGLVIHVPVLVFATLTLLWFLRQHQLNRARLTYAAWQEAQDKFINAQVDLVAARLEARSAKKLFDAVEAAFKVVSTNSSRWRADIFRETKFRALLEQFEMETTPVQVPVNWSTYSVELWTTLLDLPMDTQDDIQRAKHVLISFVSGKTHLATKAGDHDALKLLENVRSVRSTAACVLHLSKNNMSRDELTNIEELIGLPPYDRRFLKNAEDNPSLQVDGKNIPVSLDDTFLPGHLGRVLIRLRPNFSLRAIFAIEDWRREYQRVLDHDSYDGSTRLMTRAQLHPTRAGVVSPAPDLLISPEIEYLGGYPYSIAVILLAALLHRGGNKDLWLEWATQLQVEVRSHNLDWLNFDELCGAMQEQPATVYRLLSDLLANVPVSLSESDEPDFNIMPLVSETYADWEVWAVRRIRAAFTRDDKYHIEHRKWLTRCWAGLCALPLIQASDAADAQVSFTGRNKPPRFEHANEMKIGLWGTPQVGKTMYLLMLLRALERASSNWSIDPIDDASYQFWKQNQKRLEMENRFPEKTVKTIDYGYWIGYKAENETGEALFELSVTDTAGELYAEFFTETQRNKKVKVRQRLTESLDSDQTPRDIFDKLLQCEGIIVLIDPNWSAAGMTPPGQMLRDLLNEIRNAKQGARQEMPFIALCLTKIDGDNQLWGRKDKHPEELNCTRHMGVCSDCMVFEQLQADFMTNALSRLSEPDYIRCFILSSVGRKKMNENEDHINVSSNEKWQRPFTPIYTPYRQIQSSCKNVANALDAYHENGFPLPNKGEGFPDGRRQFMPTLVKDYQALTPYNVDEPLIWLYERISQKREASDTH